MTNEEQKKMIMDVINATDISVELRRDDIIILADALIAAGIGDVREAERKAFIYAAEIEHLDIKLKASEQLRNQYCRALLNLARRYVVKTNMTLPHGNEPNSRSTDIEMLALYIMANEREQAEKELAEEK